MGRIMRSLRGFLGKTDTRQVAHFSLGNKPEVFTVKGLTGPGECDKAMFLDHKMNFDGGVNGEDVHSLANAYNLGLVRRGDMLNVDAFGEVRNLLYLAPDKVMLGEHHFLPEKPYKDMPSQIILSRVQHWEKIGHRTPEEYNAMVEEINAN